MTQLREHSAFQDRPRPGEGASSAPAGPGDRPTEGGDTQLLRLDLHRALQLHRGLALTLAILGLAAAVFTVVRMWPSYKAQSQVYLQPAAPKVLEQGTTSRWGSDAQSYESFIQQEVQSVTQPPVLLGAIHKLAPGDWQQGGESDEAAAERLGKTIKTERVGGSYQVTITAFGRSADAAAKVANALAASLIENVARQEKAGNPERIAMLKEERDRIQNQLNSDRSEQEALSKQLGMAAVNGGASNLYDSESSQIRAELIRARTEHDQAAARLGALGGGKTGSSRSLDAMADEVMASDAGLNSLKTTLDQRRAILVSQMANLTPSNPQYKQDAAELTQIDASLESNVKDLRARVSQRIQQQLRSDLARTAEVEERLNAQMGRMAGAAVGATPKLQRANDLATNIVRLQNRFTAVDDQLHNMLIEDSAPGAAFLSAAATPPLHPTYGGIVRKALPMAVGGILLGLLAAILAHKLDSRLYVAADLEHILGFAPMAQLPDFDEVSEGVAEEHIFRLSAAIAHAHQSGSLRSCIFTAIGPGAGVTTLVGKVRTMLGTMGRATTLVDTSGTPPPPAEDSAQGSTSLVAVQRGSRSSALLQRFAEEKEAPEQSLILTDTAPLPISAETEYLARFVDAVVVVVESGVTTRAQLRATANTLQRLEVSAVGFVLNRIRLKSADPVFRQTVQDMERHQQSQSRSSWRRPERSQPVFASVAAHEGRAAESQNPTPLATLAAEVAAKASSLGHAAQPVSAPRPAPAPAPAPAQAASQLEDLFVPAPVPPLEAAAKTEPPPPTQTAASQPQRLKIVEPAAKTADQLETPLFKPSRVSRAKNEHEDLAYRFEMALERTMQMEPDVQEAPSSPAPAAWATTYEVDSPAAAPARLESLRNLVAGSERNQRPAADAPFRQDPAPPPGITSAEQWLREYGLQLEPAPLPTRPASSPAPLPVPAPMPLEATPVAVDLHRFSSIQTTVSPEILPPKPLAEEPQIESSRLFTPPSRHRSGEEDDDMQILPSRRGQYLGRR
jgi:uncharacterized protein involved in exopolysaccharide biosynthesis